MELQSTLYKPLVRIQNCKAAKNQTKIENATIFGKYKIFVERLKDSNQSKQNIRCQTRCQTL